MKTIGDVDRFALRFALRAYPDPAGDAVERASWGELQLWVAGRNLTSARLRSGGSVAGAEVPLLPLAQWFMRNWDAMFHEERLPRPSRAPSSAEWRLAVLNRLPDAEEELDALLEARERWWSGHSLASALPSYQIPDLSIRRVGDRVEISWDDREQRQLGGVHLVERPGAAILPLVPTAEVVREFCSTLADGLAAVPEVATEVAWVQRELGALDAPARALPRAELVVGTAARRFAESLRALTHVVGGTVEGTLRAILDLDESSTVSGVLPSLSIPMLLLRSASPAASARDVQALLTLRGLGGQRDGRIEAFQEPCSPVGAPGEVTEEGYGLALRFREVAQISNDAPLLGDHDLERLIALDLGVRLEELHLDDVQVEGVALLEPGRSPVIGVNRSGRFTRSPGGRRMTLAHELCHLLHDLVGDGGSVSVVSGPWASPMIERRANAFAAMLLAPEAAVQRFLPRDSERWTRADLRQAMAGLGVSASMLTVHLHNLGWISRPEQQAWLDELAMP